MKRQLGIGPKQVLLVFVAALVFYLVAFYGVEHLRHRKGPWMTAFSTGDSGEPVVTVRHSKLGIDSVTLRFPGERVENVSGPGWVEFDVPGRSVPFGQVIYEDLTFLPGVVTFNLFGHEVELLPRVLLVNKREIVWESGRVVVLQMDEKLSQPPRPPRGGTREGAP